VIVFNSIVQPKRRMKEKGQRVALQLPAVAWPLPAEARRAHALRRLRRRTSHRPDRDQEHETRALFVGSHRNRQNLSMIEPSRRHGHLDPGLRINGPSPRDLGDRSFTVVSSVPIASVS
jgi:hypothetical protein